MLGQTQETQQQQQETQVQSLGREDPPEKYLGQYSGLKFHGLYSPLDHKELDTTEQLSLSLSFTFTMTIWPKYMNQTGIQERKIIDQSNLWT